MHKALRIVLLVLLNWKRKSLGKINMLFNFEIWYPKEILESS